MKAEVCTNVLRAESVSNTYYHKLALKCWKLAALQLPALPFPVCEPRQKHTDVDTSCSPLPCVIFCLGKSQSGVWRGGFVCLFAHRSVPEWERTQTSPSNQTRELKSDVWMQIFEVPVSETWSRGGGEQGISKPEAETLSLEVIHVLFC